MCPVRTSRVPYPPTPKKAPSETGIRNKINGINTLCNYMPYRTVNATPFFVHFSFIFGLFVSIFDAKRGLNHGNPSQAFPLHILISQQSAMRAEVKPESQLLVLSSDSHVYPSSRSLIMKKTCTAALFLAVSLTALATAQDSSPSIAPGQDGSGQGQNQGGGYGQRGAGRGWGGGMMGRGLIGTVTEVAADHYTIKTDAGETYTVHYSANTRIFKMPAGGMRRGGGETAGQGGGQGGNPPQEIKASDIKAGDIIEARGEVDSLAKSVGAVAIVQVDPERAKQIREMQANYGKTWLAGKVTAIDGVKVTLMSSIDNASHAFVADENTTFRRRREPITLADIQVGDMVRVEGAVKGGTFTATTVGDMGAPPENTTVPRNPPAAQ